MNIAPYRICIFSLIKLSAPLHIGSGKDEDVFSDQPVIRDSRNVPFIPAGTLAGMFSSALQDDPEKQKQWLTPKNKDDEFLPSPMVFDDAYPLPEQAKVLRYPVEIRDQVTIKRGSLTAKEEHHFNTEVLPVGTVFCFFCRIDLKIREDVKLFKAKMEGFLSAGGALGGKKNAGSGRWQAKEWAVREFDLSSTKNLLEWLTNGHGLDWQGDWNKLKDVLGLPCTKLSAPSSDDAPWEMKLKVNIEGGLHLSAGSSGLPIKEMPDLRQARRMCFDKNGNLDSEPIDYGTAVKGRLRTAMEMLLRSYLIRNGMDPCTTKKKVPLDPTERPGWDEMADLFGHAGKNRNDPSKRGAWQVEEVSWKDSDDTGREDHIRLNEFTQQTITGLKFEFSPLRSGDSEIIVRLLEKKVPDWQKELVYHAGKLLSFNILPWGGFGSRGYLGASIQFADEESVTSSFTAGALFKKFRHLRAPQPAPKRSG